MLDEISKCNVSPFEFFEGLSKAAEERFGALQYSQINAYSLITSYAISTLSLSENEKQRLIASERLDFLINENGSVPPFLRGDLEKPVIPIIRSELIRRSVFEPAISEVHRFGFDQDTYYVIDRKNHSCIKVCLDSNSL